MYTTFITHTKLMFNYRFCLNRQAAIILTAVMLVSLSGVMAQAGWLIDAGTFHVSAHGQMSCSECHPDINEQSRHPDQADVNKTISDFFYIDRCTQCHDEVVDNLDDGMHGGQKVERTDQYENCLSCHNPHEQLMSTEDRDGYDPQKSPFEQCGACHEERNELPAVSEEDVTCVTCHVVKPVEDATVRQQVGNMCFHCHADGDTPAQVKTRQTASVIDTDAYRNTVHADLSCLTCHPDAAGFAHGNQKSGDCRQCHLPHDEKIAHDAHLGVSCQACHMTGVIPHRQDGQILWRKSSELPAPTNIHEMNMFVGNRSCSRCHFSGNRLGASAMILPSKSILCMPCHAATLSIGDSVTVSALIIFAVGMGLILLLFFSTSASLGSNDASYSKDIQSKDTIRSEKRPLAWGLIIKTIVLDVLLQKRLYDRSPRRWIIHGLIFFPFMLRFVWGIVALTGSLWLPQLPWVWALIDKNIPVNAVFFDITGLMILCGVVLALTRKGTGTQGPVGGLPVRDWPALVLIGAIVLVGFILEGMRMAMTGALAGPAAAFVGHAIGLLFHQTKNLTEYYGYIWYLHAVLTGAFFAYLPFSRLRHIIFSPIVLALNAKTEKH
jgi:nitrate reductase gamma subunit